MSIDRNKLIMQLHVLKRQLALDDETYRDKLESLTGHRSAGDLSLAELKAAVTGFRGDASATSGRRLPPGTIYRKMQALWVSLYNLGVVRDNSDGALIAFAKRQTGIDAMAWVKNTRDVEAVIEALKSWLEREGVDWSHERTTPKHLRGPVYKICLAQWLRLERLGIERRSHTWTGNPQHVTEGLFRFAEEAVRNAPPIVEWDNRQWSIVSKVLGQKIRAAMGPQKQPKGAVA